MDVSQETWDSEENENTKTLYYCENCGQSTDKVFYSQKFTADLQDVAPRTFEAFEKSLESDWTFLARPNSSCYVHKRNLVAFCETLPKENVICGVMTEGEHPFLWGGCQYIFSRDVIEKFVANKDKWRTDVMEDNAISLMSESLGMTLESKGRCASINLMPDGSWLCMTYNHGQGFTFQDFGDIPKLAHGHFFFRVKHDPDRSVDLKVMRLLHDHYH
jgi:hypothetical protein